MFLFLFKKRLLSILSIMAVVGFCQATYYYGTIEVQRAFCTSSLMNTR